MKLAILGATGALGKVLVQQAIKRGHNIRILCRNDIQANSIPASVEVVKGDYFDAESLRETLMGVDVVLSTIGPPQHNKTSLKPADFERGMRQLTLEMHKEGVKRIINVASTGTRFGAEHYGLWRRVFRVLLRFIAPIVIPGKELELKVLAESDLNWTTVRPPLIQAGIGGSLYVDDQTPQGMRVDTESLANFMLDQINRSDWIHRAPFVSSL